MSAKTGYAYLVEDGITPRRTSHPSAQALESATAHWIDSTWATPALPRVEADAIAEQLRRCGREVWVEPTDWTVAPDGRVYAMVGLDPNVVDLVVVYARLPLVEGER